MHPSEGHFSRRIGWLRAAVLGANDGIVSTSSLIIGVAAADVSRDGLLIAGLAGLVAGAMSMAAGEYVSVCSQADTEKADLARERHELATQPAAEHRELTAIYIERGLDPALASRVARQLMAHDPLGAHARDELGLTEVHTARPVQAALASAGTFVLGAGLPLLAVVLTPMGWTIPVVAGSSLACLAALGALAARAGGAGLLTGAGRVTIWGILAMILTAAIGRLTGAIL